MENKYLPFCRYYKGEKECPYSENESKRDFWYYENAWVQMESSTSNLLERYQKRYIESEFNDKIKDSVPIRLKSLLYNRYCHFVDFQGSGFLDYYKMYVDGIS